MSTQALRRSDPRARTLAARAYLAGVLDSEGSVVISPEGTVRVSITQNGSKWLESLRELAGSIGGIGSDGAGRRSRKWYITDQADVRWLLVWLKPFVRMKQSEINWALWVMDYQVTPSTARQALYKIRANRT